MYIKEVIDYCKRHGIEYTLNDNPTEEEIKRIKDKLKRSKELVNRIVNAKLE